MPSSINPLQNLILKLNCWDIFLYFSAFKLIKGMLPIFFFYLKNFSDPKLIIKKKPISTIFYYSIFSKYATRYLFAHNRLDYNFFFLFNKYKILNKKRLVFKKTAIQFYHKLLLPSHFLLKRNWNFLIGKGLHFLSWPFSSLGERARLESLILKKKKNYKLQTDEFVISKKLKKLFFKNYNYFWKQSISYKNLKYDLKNLTMSFEKKSHFTLKTKPYLFLNSIQKLNKARTRSFKNLWFITNYRFYNDLMTSKKKIKKTLLLRFWAHNDLSDVISYKKTKILKYYNNFQMKYRLRLKTSKILKNEKNIVKLQKRFKFNRARRSSLKSLSDLNFKYLILISEHHQQNLNTSNFLIFIKIKIYVWWRTALAASFNFTQISPLKTLSFKLKSWKKLKKKNSIAYAFIFLNSIKNVEFGGTFNTLLLPSSFETFLNDQASKIASNKSILINLNPHLFFYIKTENFKILFSKNQIRNVKFSNVKIFNTKFTFLRLTTSHVFSYLSPLSYHSYFKTNFLSSSAGFGFLTLHTNRPIDENIGDFKKNLFSFATRYEMHKRIVKLSLKNKIFHFFNNLTVELLDDALAYDWKRFVFNSQNNLSQTPILNTLISLKQRLNTKFEFLSYEEMPISAKHANLSIKRIKFKPGYRRIWKEARAVAKIPLNLNYRYEYRFTKYLLRYTKFVKLRFLIPLEMTIFNILKQINFVFYNHYIEEFLMRGLIFVNGFVCKNKTLQIYENDFLQFIVNVSYYIIFKYITNFFLKRKIKLKIRLKKKSPNAVTDLTKKKSSSLPNWLLFEKNIENDVPNYIEMDLFSLSFFILYEPFLLNDLYYPNTENIRHNIMALYNWKYIT